MPTKNAVETFTYTYSVGVSERIIRVSALSSRCPGQEDLTGKRRIVAEDRLRVKYRKRMNPDQLNLSLSVACINGRHCRELKTLAVMDIF